MVKFKKRLRDKIYIVKSRIDWMKSKNARPIRCRKVKSRQS